MLDLFRHVSGGIWGIRRAADMSIIASRRKQAPIYADSAWPAQTYSRTYAVPLDAVPPMGEDGRTSKPSSNPLRFIFCLRRLSFKGDAPI
jgi:hypothetical protein